MKLNKMLDKYTAEELADAFVFRSELNDEEENTAANELREARKALKEKQTPEQKLYMNLLQLKFQMQNYVKGDYNKEFSFGYFLKRYVDLLGKFDKDFADDIDISKSKLSHLINNRRNPNEQIIIRLELHSNNLIPAISWIKVLEKQKEHDIISDKKIRKEESKHVKNRLEFSF